MNSKCSFRVFRQIHPVNAKQMMKICETMKK
jgi:hypothetical protein